jgi:methionine synthase I (cobalamin-dependent)
MEPIITPKLTVSFAVDLEVSYDSFSGKTPDQIAIALQDELDSLLFETSPDVVGVYTSISNITNNG